MDLPNAKMAAYYIVNILGAKRVAAIYALMDGPITQSRSVMKEVAKLGAKAVREETHMEGDKDYTAQLTKIIAENPDLIFTSNFYTEAGTLIRQARGLGYKGLIMGGDGAYSNELIKIAGKENAEGVMCWAAFHHGSSKPEVQAYVAAYREKYKGENPDTYGACAYAGTGVIVTALQKTIKGGEVDRKRIRDYIAGIGTTNPPYPGVTGMIKFDNNGDVETSLKIAVIRNGDFELAPKQLE